VSAGPSLDLDVRLWIYERFARLGTAPSSQEIADAFGIEPTDAQASLLRLTHDHDALVLSPGTTEIWMAEPFSAVPTPFGVRGLDGRTWWGNCIWDGLGILGLLGADGVVETPCPDCRSLLRVEIRDGALSGDAGVVHFAVPAAEWWRDIGFT
jgi:hypothetical protein